MAKSIEITGLTNDLLYGVRLFPRNPRKQFQTELEGATATMTPRLLSLYQKYAYADVLKPKYSASHGLYVGHKTSENWQPYYSPDLITWTKFTNTYYQTAGSFDGGMGEAYPMQDKIFVHGWFNSIADYGGRNYLYRYDTPTSSYSQVGYAVDDGRVYPIIDNGSGFFTQANGKTGTKTSHVSNDAINWSAVTYRQNPVGGVTSDGKVYIVNDAVTTEFQLIEIDIATKAETTLYVGHNKSYANYCTLMSKSFCDTPTASYWAYNSGNGGIARLSKASGRALSNIQTNIPAPVKLVQFLSTLNMFLAVDVNNNIYFASSTDLSLSSNFSKLEYTTGGTINSLSVGNNEFIIQADTGIFVLK